MSESTNELRKAAREVFGSDVEMQGAGRTDAGVHALGQVMHIKVVSQVRQPVDVIQRRMNDLLPPDIVILQFEQAAKNFHARHDALSRVYFRAFRALLVQDVARSRMNLA